MSPIQFIFSGDFARVAAKSGHRVFWGVIRNLSPLFIGAPYIIWINIVITIWVLFFSALTPNIFVITDILWRAYFIAAQFLYAAINNVTAFFYHDTRLWEEILDTTVNNNKNIHSPRSYYGNNLYVYYAMEPVQQ